MSGEERGKGRKNIHIVPVRFKPKTITFIGRVRTEGSVSTRRPFCGWDSMLAIATSSYYTVVGVGSSFQSGWMDFAGLRDEEMRRDNDDDG